MMRLGFDIKVQVIRVLVTFMLLQYVSYLKPQTPASCLDKAWLEEFFILMLAFFVFINCVFIMPLAMEAPQLLYIIARFFGGAIVALISHIYKGFSLYDELSKEELENGRDSVSLYFMRVFFLFFCVAFTGYLLTSCMCLCALGGVDGSHLRNVRNPSKMFKRVPFGNLVFQEGLDCAICMERFNEQQRVV